MKRIVPLVAALLITGSTLVAQPTDAELAAAFYPQRLVDEYEADIQEGDAVMHEGIAYVSRNDHVLAAYTNGFGAAIRVLHRDGNSAAVVTEPALPLQGVQPSIELVDLDGAGTPEAIVSFTAAGRRSSNWVFRWEGPQLDLIGPSAADENGDSYTLLTDAGWLDFDGDGALELYASRALEPDFDQEPGPSSFDVYRLVDGRYVAAGTASFVSTFHRSKGAPIEETHELRTDTPGAYRLRVIKGDAVGNDRVSSATISINGADVITPNMLGQNVASLTASVTLQNVNTIVARLAGSPGGVLTIVIEPQ